MPILPIGEPVERTLTQETAREILDEAFYTGAHGKFPLGFESQFEGADQAGLKSVGLNTPKFEVNIAEIPKVFRSISGNTAASLDENKDTIFVFREDIPSAEALGERLTNYYPPGQTPEDDPLRARNLKYIEERGKDANVSFYTLSLLQTANPFLAENQGKPERDYRSEFIPFHIFLIVPDDINFTEAMRGDPDLVYEMIKQILGEENLSEINDNGVATTPGIAILEPKRIIYTDRQTDHIILKNDMTGTGYKSGGEIIMDNRDIN